MAAKKKGGDPLGNWSLLNSRLMAMNEEEVAALLKKEKAGQGRLTFLLRLQARLNKLRRERERGELAAGAKR